MKAESAAKTIDARAQEVAMSRVIDKERLLAGLAPLKQNGNFRYNLLSALTALLCGVLAGGGASFVVLGFIMFV
jgi:hypothetical protein